MLTEEISRSALFCYPVNLEIRDRICSCRASVYVCVCSVRLQVGCAISYIRLTLACRLK